jgi:hypothetical protein
MSGERDLLGSTTSTSASNSMSSAQKSLCPAIAARHSIGWPSSNAASGLAPANNNRRDTYHPSSHYFSPTLPNE